MLCLIASLVHAEDCEQNYVRVYYAANPGDNLPAAHTAMTNIVLSQVNWACISVDDPAFDDISTCWYTTTPPSPTVQWVCGFRIYRAYKSCDISHQSHKLSDQLNWAFIQAAFRQNTYLWQVFDTGPTGNVHCDWSGTTARTGTRWVQIDSTALNIS